MLFRSALHDEEIEAEKLRKDLLNNAEESEMIKLDIHEKISTLAETQNELESLRNILSENQLKSSDIEQELLNTKAALVESETLVQSLNESLTETHGQEKELHRVNEAFIQTQAILGEHYYYFVVSSYINNSLFLSVLLHGRNLK